MPDYMLVRDDVKGVLAQPGMLVNWSEPQRYDVCVFLFFFTVFDLFQGCLSSSWWMARRERAQEGLKSSEQHGAPSRP